jgi:hypothetical protein
VPLWPGASDRSNDEVGVRSAQEGFVQLLTSNVALSELLCEVECQDSCAVPDLE